MRPPSATSARLIPPHYDADASCGRSAWSAPTSQSVGILVIWHGLVWELAGLMVILGMEYNESDSFPRRKHHRLAGREYCGGHYFVTVCTLNHAHYFGHVVDGHMQLSALGHVLYRQLSELPQRYQTVSMPVFIVMPNHFHCIIEIGIDGLHHDESVNGFTGSGMQRSRLGVIMGDIKSRVSKRARAVGCPFGWQRGYYDRVIRDRDEWTLIEQYIMTNPANWDTDTMNR